MKFLLKQEAIEHWTWELKNDRGETMCFSADTFRSREEVFTAVQATRIMASGALVFDPLGTLYESI